MPPRPHHDVVIVGGGAMGAAAAWALAGAGRDVLLLERFEFGHHRGGSHGASRLFRLDYSSPASLDFALRAQRLWREIETEGDVRLLDVVGGAEHGLAAEHVAAAHRVCAERGVALESLTPDAAAERWTGMRFESEVLYQPDAARVSADDAVAALHRLAQGRGAELRDNTRVSGLEVDDATVRVHTTDEVLHARHVVVAAGPWAPQLLDGVAPLPPVVVRQEQPGLFRAPDPGDRWPAFVHWRHEPGPRGTIESYGVGEPSGRVKVGLHATGPISDPDERTYTPDRELAAYQRDYVRTWFPGLDADDEEPVSCLYDLTPDGRHVIERTGPVTVAAGFSGTGFKYVPAVGALVRDLVLGEHRQAEAIS